VTHGWYIGWGAHSEACIFVCDYMASQPLRHLHTALGCLCLCLPLPFASASASAFHCLYLCHNNYLVVLKSVYVFYCFFFGCFNFLFPFYFRPKPAMQDFKILRMLKLRTSLKGFLEVTSMTGVSTIT
jgi:hypothetical protein